MQATEQAQVTEGAFENPFLGVESKIQNALGEGD